MMSSERDIFLSHRSVDKDFVRRLASDIESEYWQGRKLLTWLDEAEIPVGGSIPGHIERGLQNSRFVALIMTPAYFESPSGWPDAEWHAALHKDPDNRRHRLIPILAADCPYIPFLLRHLKSVDLRTEFDYKNGLREIRAALRNEPAPLPVTHRGQLITTSGTIDKAQIISERASIDALPDIKTELLQCNLLPVSRLPGRIWTAPVRPELLGEGRDGELTIPTKKELIAAARAGQSEADFETVFTPAFRVSGDAIVSFHDLSDPGGPLASIVDEGAAEDFITKTYMVDEDQRRIAISLLNMAISRHAHRCDLVVDSTKRNRFFFPPKNGTENVITWRPNKNKASRTVAKPMQVDGETRFWRHLGAYLNMLYLADKLYLQIEPTWVLTDDGITVKSGPDIGRVVIRWTGRERNLHVLYHVRFWTAILQKSKPGPLSISAGDQTLEISQQPVSAQVPYGILSDHKDLLNALDTEAQILAEEEDEMVDDVLAGDADTINEVAEKEAEDGGVEDGPWTEDDEAP
jgi:TIR domain